MEYLTLKKNINMKKISTPLLLLTILISILTIRLGYSQEWPGIKDSIYSNELKEFRDFQVVLPKDYRPDSQDKFEVLYILDGEWYMEQVPFIYDFTVAANFTPQNIYVLIPNTYIKKDNLRSRDFSPSKISERPNSGGADSFHSFLKNELIPHIDKTYPTNGKKSLLGSSFGGLFTLYAFVKEPDLFQSFIASDPSIWWDNNYVSKLATERISTLSNSNSTLFIAGLENTFDDMGIKKFDSVLKSSKPLNPLWQIIPYTNETHYSVQHKGFYDGIRFSHLGYNKNLKATIFHPMNGILEKGKPIEILVVGDSPDLSYTIDGSVPNLSSEKINNGSEIVLNEPSILKVKSFPNRQEYIRNLIGDFKQESTMTFKNKLKRGKTAQLEYAYFEGDWKKFPDIKNLKPTGQENVKKDFDLNQHKGESNTLHLIQGTIEIKEEGYYVFGIDSKDGAKLNIGGQQLINYDGNDGNEQSIVVPLKKGFYTLHLEIFRKSESPNIDFRAFHSTEGNDKWWQNRFALFP